MGTVKDVMCFDLWLPNCDHVSIHPIKDLNILNETMLLQVDCLITLFSFPFHRIQHGKYH